MGIKPSYIKNLAKKLLIEYGEDFDGDFDANKQRVTERTNVVSKVIRNRIAGYITRKKNRSVEFF